MLFALQLDQEGVEPDEGSPAARGEMASILKELGFDAEASLRGTPGDEQTWWERESAARREQASSSAAASAEAAAQQREDQQARQAEEDEGDSNSEIASQWSDVRMTPCKPSSPAFT